MNHIVNIISFSSLILLLCSCGQSEFERAETIEKCDLNYGLERENLNFRTDNKIYKMAVNHLIHLRKYSKEENINLNKNCGFKEIDAISCFRFIDSDRGSGYKVCVTPYSGELLSYSVEI